MTSPKHRERILLVSLDADAREKYARAFRTGGFCTLQAATPADACRLAAELAPAAVVADVSASLCDDGVPLWCRLNRRRNPTRYPVVFLAGAPASGDLLTLERAGSDVFVIRPGNPYALVQAVSRLVGRRVPTSHGNC